MEVSPPKNLVKFDINSMRFLTHMNVGLHYDDVFCCDVVDCSR